MPRAHLFGATTMGERSYASEEWVSKVCERDLEGLKRTTEARTVWSIDNNADGSCGATSGAAAREGPRFRMGRGVGEFAMFTSV